MKKHSLGLFLCLSLAGCGDPLGYNCHGLIPEAPPPDSATFRVTEKLHIGFYEDATRGWGTDLDTLSQTIDQYFMDSLNCSAEKLHGTITIRVLGAAPIEGIDLPIDEGAESPYSTYLEAGKSPFPVFSGSLPSDFRIVLTEPRVCLEGKSVNGETGYYEDHLFVWANMDYPDLFRHEFLHVLAAVLHLSDAEERSLYPCAPRAPHGADQK